MDPAAVDRFVAEHTATLSLRDGTTVLLRPIVPADKENLRDGFARMSPDSRYRRFLTSLGSLDARTLAYLTEIDYRDHFAYVALTPDVPGRPGIGVARYVRLRSERGVAEAAVTVVDDYQRRGLGRILLESLVPVALANGIGVFRGYLLVENHPMVELLRSIGARLRVDEPGVLRMDLDLPEIDRELAGSPLYDALRAVARGEIEARHPQDEPEKGAAEPRTG